MRPEFARAPIAQRLVRALRVVPADPYGQLAPGVLEVDEVVLPDAFLLQGAEEALDDSVLLRCVRENGRLRPGGRRPPAGRPPPGQLQRNFTAHVLVVSPFDGVSGCKACDTAGENDVRLGRSALYFRTSTLPLAHAHARAGGWSGRARRSHHPGDANTRRGGPLPSQDGCAVPRKVAAGHQCSRHGRG